MTNEEIIEQLYKIGKLPTAVISDETNFPLKEFDELLLKIQLPISEKIALKLINLSPPVDTSCHEVEWSLVHLAEKVDTEKLQSILDKSDDGEVKEIIQIHLNNYNKKNRQ